MTSGRGLEPVAADHRFTDPGGGTEPAPETAAELFADSAAMRGLPTITSIEVAPIARAGFSAGCYFAGDIHQACDINIARGSSATLAVSVFMIPDRRDPQHRYVVDSFFFPPIQNAIVFVERASRGASVEDLVATQIYADPLNTKTAVPNRPSELNAKAKILATAGPASVSARPASRTEGPHDCRAVLGRATTLACTIDIAKDASVITVVVTMDGINAPHYKVSDFTTT